MKRFGMLMAGALVLGLAACGGQTAEENGAGIASQAQGLERDVTQVCGFTCPSGYYASMYTCNSACSGSCWTGTNAAQCVQILPEDTQFNACGTSCPDPFTAFPTYSTYCVQTYPSSGANNSVICSR